MQQNNQSPSLPLWKRLLKEKSGTDLSANVAKYKYKDLAEDNLASLAEALTDSAGRTETLISIFKKWNKDGDYTNILDVLYADLKSKKEALNKIS